MNTPYNTLDIPYNIKEWAAETAHGRQVYNYNFRIPGTEIRGWKLL